MASSRGSSLTETSTSTPTPLTPQSKVNALLARFDDSSDDESRNAGTARARLAARRKKGENQHPDTTNTLRKTDSEKSLSRLADAEVQKEIGIEKEASSAAIGEEEEEEEAGGTVGPFDDKPFGQKVRARLQAKSDDHGSSLSSLRIARLNAQADKNQISPFSPCLSSQQAYSDDNVLVRSGGRNRKAAAASTPLPNPHTSSSSSGLLIPPASEKLSSSDKDTSNDELLPENSATRERVAALAAKFREARRAKGAQAKREKAEQAVNLRKHAASLKEIASESSEHDNGRRLTQQAHPKRKASKKAMMEMARESQRLARTHQATYISMTKKKFSRATLFDKFNFHPDGDNTSKALSSSPAPCSDVETQETPPTSPATPHEDLKLVNRYDDQMNTILEDRVDAFLIQEAAAQAEPASTVAELDKGEGKVPKPLAKIARSPMSKQHLPRFRPSAMDAKVDEPDDELEIVRLRPSAQRTRLDHFLTNMPERKAPGSHSLHVLRILANVTSPSKQCPARNKKASINSSILHKSLQQRARRQAALERQERMKKLKGNGVIIQSAEERAKAMAEVEDIMARARREGVKILKREKAAAKMEREANGDLEITRESSSDEDWAEGFNSETKQGGLSGAEHSEVDSEEGQSDTDAENEGDDEDEEDEEAEEVQEVKEDEEDGFADTKEGAGVKTAITTFMFAEEVSESQDERQPRVEASDPSIKVVRSIEEEEEEEDYLPIQQRNFARRSNIILDEDDEDDEGETMESSIRHTSPLRLSTESPAAPISVLRSASKTFIPGLTIAGPAGLGLTQIFAGTMDGSQDEVFKNSLTSADIETPLKILKDDTLACAPLQISSKLSTSRIDVETGQDIELQTSQSEAVERQAVSEENPIQLDFSQAQYHCFDSLNQDTSPTQVSEFGIPTQDMGFDKSTPIRNRFAEPPPSTVDTVLLDGFKAMPATPVMKPRRKLKQMMQFAALSDDGTNITNEGHLEAGDTLPRSKNAYSLMHKASKKAKVENLDKKRSLAREMVNEQAEESDDEYAGLGGVSDDESGEEDTFVDEMIDDNYADNDEGKLAAFFAGRERANDEKQVEKLYKDITKGMLRRKKGDTFDLSDSDDDGEARRRMKQREFAKMRKALLVDERIGKIAENPKRQAFLRSIEDRGSDDGMDFLGDSVEPAEAAESQSQSQSRPYDEGSQRIPDSQPELMGPPSKRKFAEHPAASTQSRLPPNLRRTKPDKRPSSLNEIRESLSSLIEEPHGPFSNISAGSESDQDEELLKSPRPPPAQKKASFDSNKENRNPFHPRRTNTAVIDRISLKRSFSTGLASSNTRLAFAAGASAAPTFKAPLLLRRATTNNSLASGSSSGNRCGMSTTERMAGGTNSGVGGLRKGAGKSSGVNYFRRDEERRKAAGEREKRREQKMLQGSKERRDLVGGLFGGGKFE